LRKVSEIYDRIAFGGVGRYNEFDQLRIAGVRAADLKGYSFSREDVDARSLANQYAQILGQIFTHEVKPMEVEILVAEVGADADHDQLFHILYDGTVVDEQGSAVLGGDAEAIAERVAAQGLDHPDVAAAIAAATAALAGPDRVLGAAELEVALLARNGERRCFRRLDDDEVSGYLGSPAAPTAP
jgi:proteasome alpha subunit